ncbi:hypothetical protein P7K49_035505, partial [Saguinus oedipus]
LSKRATVKCEETLQVRPGIKGNVQHHRDEGSEQGCRQSGWGSQGITVQALADLR